MVASTAAARTDAVHLLELINVALGSELQYDLVSGVSGRVSKSELSHGKDENVSYCFVLHLHELFSVHYHATCRNAPL